jgi:hypothetical protein
MNCILIKQNITYTISRARLITAKAIYLKLCTYVPQGQTKFRSDLILGLATRGPSPISLLFDLEHSNLV